MQSTVTLLTIFSTSSRPFTLQVWAIYKFIRILLILLQIRICTVLNTFKNFFEENEKLLEIFAYPSNNRMFYRLELNL